MGVREVPGSGALTRRLVLASASPARARLLHDAGFGFEVVVSGVDEGIDGLDTAGAVVALAERKASAVAKGRKGDLVLGCDSMLDLDGVAIGKPSSPNEALDIWRRLSGHQGTLHTGHCLIDTNTDRRVSAVARTVVHFDSPTASELSAYVATGQAVGLAGGFSIDGFAAPFVKGIEGDPSNVLGLSLPLLRRMLADFGITIMDLWRRW